MGCRTLGREAYAERTEWDMGLGRKTSGYCGGVWKKTLLSCCEQGSGDRTGAADAGFFLQPYSSSHCQDILPAVGMYFRLLSLGTQSLALAIAEQHRQMPPQIPAPWKALLSHWRWRTSLLASNIAQVLGHWTSSSAVWRGWSPLYAAFSVQQRGYFSEPGSPDPVLLESGMAPSLHRRPLRSWPSFSHWYLDV